MRLVLPEGDRRKAELQEALRHHYHLGLREMYRHSGTWTHVHHYLMGLRSFKGVWSNGTVSFEDRTGERVVRWEHAVAATQIEMGRVLMIDTAPAVIKPPGVTLNGLRSSAAQQASLDYLSGRWPIESIKLLIGYFLTAFGTAGLGVWGPGVPALAQYVYPEVIPPWELLPLPGVLAASGMAAGLVRRRIVDLEWLREAVRPFVSKFPDKADLNIRTGVPGAALSFRGDPSGAVREAPAAGTDAPSKKYRYDSERSRTTRQGQYVLLKEYRTFGPDDNSCARWMVEAGNALLFDHNYLRDVGGDPEQPEDTTPADLPVFPLTMGRYLPLGGFYGRGLADRLVFLNQEIEGAMGNLFQNLHDLDWFGMLLMPADTGLNLNAFHETRRGRYATYYPDLGGSQVPPTHIAPSNIGTMGAQALSMVAEMLGAVSNQGELFSGRVPGRLESARSLGVYLEAQNTPMSPVIEGIAGMFKGAYRSLLAIARDVMPSEFPLRKLRLDASILGIQIDPASGKVRLSQDSLGSPYDAELTIRHKAPEFGSQKIAMLDHLLGAGVISPLLYRLAMIREGLDGHTMLDRAEYESYQKAWWENLLMYGNGEQPAGTPVGSTIGDVHPIHRFVHKQVLASIAYVLATEAVQQPFLLHYAEHQQRGTLVEGVPAFDDLVGLNDSALPPELMSQIAAAGPGGGPAGPPATSEVSAGGAGTVP